MRFDYRKLLKALAFRLPVTLLYFWVNYSIAPSLSFPSLCFHFPLADSAAAAPCFDMVVCICRTQGH